MKRRVLIRKLESNGWYKARSGNSHDIYTNGKQSEPIPRHKEINELTAKAILKRTGIE